MNKGGCAGEIRQQLYAGDDRRMRFRFRVGALFILGYCCSTAALDQLGFFTKLPKPAENPAAAWLTRL